MFHAVTIFLSLLTLIQSFYPLTLSGGIINAEHIATIYIGTPPQQFKVSIDTGSGRLAVNCRGCVNCKTHVNPPFDPKKSSSASLLTCSTPQYCSNCDAISPEMSCSHNVTYYDQSSVSGSVFSEYVSLYFDGLTGASSRLTCIESMSTEFAHDPLIDGIWGLAKNDIAEDGSLYRSDQYVSQMSRQLGQERTLSLCLSYEGGTLIIGGSDPTKHTRPPIIINYDTPQSDTISKSVGKMTIGSTIIHENAGAVMHDLIIDSGSTTSVLDRLSFEKISQAITQVCQSLGHDCLVKSQNDELCVDLSRPDLISVFPNISIAIGGEEILWPAMGYLLLTDINYPSYFCFGAYVSESGASCVLGADFMLNKDIVFSESTIEIYPESACGGKTLNEITTTVVAASPEIARKSGVNSTVFVVLLVCIPILSIGAIWACVYFRGLKKKNLFQQQVKIEGEKVVEMVVPTEVRMHHKDSDDIKV